MSSEFSTYIEKSSADLDINHGIYIDIFPLDGYPTKALEQKKLSFLKNFYLYQLNSAFRLPSTIKGKISISFFRLFGCHKRSAKIAAKYEALISKYSIKDTSLVCNHGTWYGKRDYISADYYGVGADATYEGVKVRVPEKCDEYLKSLYGDWRTPPPIEKQRGHHFYEICDTEKPYTYYLNKNKSK